MVEGEEKKVKALVVDDTAFMRKALVEILSKDSIMEVVGVAKHGEEALEAVSTLKPDVVTMDVDMPVMDGITAIKHIMVRHPLPIVMVSGLADQGRITLEALRLGAVDFFPKPSGTISLDIHEEANELQRSVRLAANIDPLCIKRARLPGRGAEKGSAKGVPAGLVVVAAHRGTSSHLIRLLANCNPSLPLALIVVHDISPKVLASYSQELDKLVPWRISHQKEGEIEAGTCILLSYEEPLGIERNKDGRLALVARREFGLDALFAEAAAVMDGSVMGVVLGGTSDQGISGLKEIRDQGCEGYILSPHLCLYEESSTMALAAGAGEVCRSEQELWARINGFGRRLALERAVDPSVHTH